MAMPTYLYESNNSPRDRFGQLEIQMDNGAIGVLSRGKIYSLTESEATRARRFIVLTPSTSLPIPPSMYVRLPVVGSLADGDYIAWSEQYAAFVPAQGGGGGGGGSTGGGNVPSVTADTGDPYRIILLSDGTVRAIPTPVQPPAAPTGLATQVHLSYVKLTWSGSTSNYGIFRNNVQIAVSTTNIYRDTSVVVGATYSYRVRAIDVYGEWSPLSSSVSAFIDPSINSAPDASVTVWPSEIPIDGFALVRVNASDVDVQQLALTLGVSEGSLAPTDDPSVWRLTVA